MLQFDQVSFAYRRTDVLSGFDLTVAAGEFTAVLGPNGSGKTTLVRLGVGHVRPSRGAVTFEGREVATIPARQRAARIAVVPQQSQLAFDFNVGEVVAMGRAPHLGLFGLDRPVDREIVLRAMEQCDVAPLAKRSYHALSGGERQRVVLARALAQQPQLLILDEPTAFLDLKHRLSVHALLQNLNRNEGLTVLVAGHDINLAARYCNRLVLLQRGTVAADGTPDEVLTPENLRRVYDVEADVRRDPRSDRPYITPVAPVGQSNDS